MENIMRIGIAVMYVALAAAPESPAAEFRLTSPDVTDGGTLAETFVLNDFGCTGGNASPALAWSGAPAGTKSFVVTVYDPDAPTGSGWWHWVVADIPATAASLPRGAGGLAGTGLPIGATQGRTDFGTASYGGPCPPQGDAPHRYVFTVHALPVAHLPVDPQISAAMVGLALHTTEIARASLIAQYGR
jgi:Raf kinase inhibitor-like YbhB/YbcL family protein